MTDPIASQFLAARRAYIAAQFQNLNDMQRQAVMTTEGPLLLLAGAGSGKTTVLIHRIANLIRFGCGSDSQEIPAEIRQEDVEFLRSGDFSQPGDRMRADALCAVRPAAPWSIIAITFTNKAAQELKTRLETAVGEQAYDVWAMTFHSACCRILRRTIDRLGYDNRFTIYDTQDSERIMKDILHGMQLDDKTFPPKSVLAQISRAKDQNQGPEEFSRTADAAGDYRLEKIAEAYTEYQHRLKANNAVDFDDLILLTVQILEQFDDVREYYQRKFHYVLVDEYQDTNLLQYRLAALLAGGRKNICVVGDDDQSIYRFRGATIQNILNFEQEYPGARCIRLEQNYRSTQSILEAANAVISHNQGRKGKTLWTANGKGDPILVFEAADSLEEANFVSSQILAQSHGQNFQNFAILYRTNAQSNALEYSFKRNGIPYRIIGGTRFFDRAEIKDMLAYLCVINNRSDDLRLLRIINNPTRGLGGKTIEMVQRLAEAEGKPLYEVISNARQYQPLERSAEKLLRFSRIIEGCAQLLQEQMPLDQFYEEVMLRTGYRAMLKEKHTEENQTRLENIYELKSSIANYMQNQEEPTLAGFLEEIALYTDIEQYDAQASAVVMMTMHSAKGLEFPNVFLVGLEEGLFPGMRSIGDPEQMEEERRLCYVAITRAKQRLTISHARMRMLYGRTTAGMPSRFLKEIPESCVEHRGGLPARTAESESAPKRSHILAEQRKAKMKQAEYSAYAASAGAQVSIDFHQGELIRHSAFGKGMILSVMKMGGDALLEIAFDDIGTKKLMAKTAASHITRL